MAFLPEAFLERADSLFSPEHLAEGIVFHHPDGRRAKIKRCDFFRGKRDEGSGPGWKSGVECCW